MSYKQVALGEYECVKRGLCRRVIRDGDGWLWRLHEGNREGKVLVEGRVNFYWEALSKVADAAGQLIGLAARRAKGGKTGHVQRR